MEKKTQLSVILTNTPGELSKLCDVLKASNVNILAMSIQNAKDSVKELFNMREKTGRRIALAESYRGILKDSSDYSLIRFLVDKAAEAQGSRRDVGRCPERLYRRAGDRDRACARRNQGETKPQGGCGIILQKVK